MRSLTVICVLLVVQVKSQPYIDIFNSSFIQNSKQVSCYNINGTIPLQSKNKQVTLVLNPYFESWKLYGTSSPLPVENVSGLGLPVMFIYSTRNERYQVILSAIFRDHDLKNHNSKNQYGGALLIGWKTNPKLNWKLGLYYNSEYFGNFMMPLLGIDWKINPKTMLFGILPGSLTLEHRLQKQVYIGASFRAVTTSFMTPSKDYLRINDNRLGLFTDLYLTKSIVLNIELGHSVLRKFQTGNPAAKSDLPFNDQPYCKMQLAYRIRLNKDNP